MEGLFFCPIFVEILTVENKSTESYRLMIFDTRTRTWYTPEEYNKSKKQMAIARIFNRLPLWGKLLVIFAVATILALMMTSHQEKKIITSSYHNTQETHRE